MKKGLLFLTCILLCITTYAQSAKYKCNLQLTNYKGLGAYIVVSLVDKQGKYVKTLYMMGKDQKWYDTMKEWDKALRKKKENLNAITSASVSDGNRSTTTFVLDESLINKGYTIRFESAVENLSYYTVDAEIPFTTAALTEKTNGKGYIRFVKLTKL